MKVVLNQDIKGLGKKLQIVEVSEGYARNFLFPKKLAVVADNKNISELELLIDNIDMMNLITNPNEIDVINYKEFFELFIISPPVKIIMSQF